jgi:FMN phosphatase YigB (HAD superfamily)
LIQFLASKATLAIVTGRPRADAIRFLEYHDILPYFKTVICMEDAPSKPDPAPVVLALQECGLQSDSTVIMIGDTPNDALVRQSDLLSTVVLSADEFFQAAQRAGIVALGILAPKERGNASMAAAIASAGALCTMSDLEELRLLFIPA